MNHSVRRAGGFAAIGALALLAPLLGRAAGAPFALLALLSLIITSGPIFEFFARPRDHKVGRLRGLFGFTLSAAVLGALAGFEGLPMRVFVATVLIVSLGNLMAVITGQYTTIDRTLGYLGGALVGATAGQGVVIAISDSVSLSVSELLTLALAGSLLAALVHSMLFSRDEPPILFSVGFLLWLLAAIGIDADLVAVSIAVIITFGLGILAYYLATASIEGMIAGILLGLLAIVLGGYHWLAVLFAFFAIGGASSKFRYEQKLEHGVAEENAGARGGENVLANSGIGMGALFLYALTEAGAVQGNSLVYVFVFTGAVATALSDTLASEIGGSYGQTRLITTFEPVAPGTDGGVTWQGFIAGVIGAGIVAGIAYYGFASVDGLTTSIIVLSGVVGMTADSLLGATVEGDLLGNSSVNFIATLVGGLTAGLIAVAVGPVTLF